MFVALLALFLLSSFTSGAATTFSSFVLASGVVVIALRRLRVHLVWVAAVAVALSGAVLALVVVTDDQGGWVFGSIELSMGALLLLSSMLVADRLLRARVVTLQTVFGAVDVYVLVGLAFSFVYHALEIISTAAFIQGPGLDGATDMSRNEAIYFSFVSLTTLGFGDFTPATDLGRSIVIIETLLGQVIIVALIARIVSLVGQRRDPAA